MEIDTEKLKDFTVEIKIDNCISLVCSKCDWRIHICTIPLATFIIFAKEHIERCN